MPLLHIRSNTTISDKKAVALAASKQTAQLLSKPENYVMVIVDDQQHLIFAGNDQPAAYLELKSINLPESQTTELSSALCDFISEQLGIDNSRVYIEFSNAQRHMWGWSGATF